jgi:hypothetical protein
MDAIFEAARAIRPYLAEMLGPKAGQVDGELARLLASCSPAGQDDALREQLEALLNRHEETNAFLEAVVDDAPNYRPPQVVPGNLRGVAAGSVLPGRAAPAPVDRYRCPSESADYVWYRSDVGVPIPLCPTHKVALIRSEPDQHAG